MKRTKHIPFDAMEEVIRLEGEIRIALGSKKKFPADLVADAKAIMAGKPTTMTGTRLERLRLIAGKFSHK